MSKWILAVFLALLGGTLVIGDADAARVGGGRSVGAQRSATPPAKPAQNTQQAAPAQSSQAAPAQTTPQPAPSAASKWGGILGGLALGGLLGYLLGGSGFGGILLLAALALVAFFVVRALLARRSGEAPQRAELAGMRGETMEAPARFESSSAPAGTINNVRIPAGFDAASFLRGARLNFMKLQVANDRGDLAELQELTTPEIFEALKSDIASRIGTQQTDIVSVDADLLELVDENGKYWASVRFSGTERDGPGAAPVGFEEVWNLVKPTDGSSGWLLAGIQQMH